VTRRGHKVINYKQPHQIDCGVERHARRMFAHVLDKKGKTIFEQDLPGLSRTWA
jgi:hypothetical protein